MTSIQNAKNASMNTSNTSNTTNTSNTSNTSNTVRVAPGTSGAPSALASDVESMAGAESAATFERPSGKRPALSGDSRVVSPAGGGTGEISAQEAIDGHSKRAGDFTEPRTVDGQQLFFTPAGARAVDAWLRRAEDNSAPLHAQRDPSFWQRFLQGDPFAGRELHSGKTK
jgi:hypothetical protein